METTTGKIILPSELYKIHSMEISIGICAYNEEANIGKLLKSLQQQKTILADIKEIIVVSSGCTDKTNEITESFCKNDSRIVLIKERERKGKASAVDLFLEQAKGDICILESADTITSENTIEQLCLPFLDENVGIVGAHPVPVDTSSNFVGFAVQFIWELHHKVALSEPKLGELIAFRNIVKPTGRIASLGEAFAAADETYIESMIHQKGYAIKYAPESYVYNKGPETLRGFLAQRKRNYLSHLHVKKMNGYEASTMNPLKLAKLIFKITIPRKLGYDAAINIDWNSTTCQFHVWHVPFTKSWVRFPCPQSIAWIFGLVVLEFWARLLATYEFHIAKMTSCMWNPIMETKDLHT